MTPLLPISSSAFSPAGLGESLKISCLSRAFTTSNSWIFFKSSSPRIELHLRSHAPCRFYTQRLDGVPHLRVQGRQRRRANLRGTGAAALVRSIRGPPPTFVSLLFLARASGALVGDATSWKVLDTTRSSSGTRRSPHVARPCIVRKRGGERIRRNACSNSRPVFSTLLSEDCWSAQQWRSAPIICFRAVLRGVLETTFEAETNMP
jgi:hypothetical protein